jgi:hypothetical protein
MYNWLKFKRKKRSYGHLAITSTLAKSHLFNTISRQLLSCAFLDELSNPTTFA